MTQATRIEISETPGILNQYGRALFAKGIPAKDPVLPDTQIVLTGITASKDKVDHYSEVCGFRQKNDELPVTYPHILAFSLHMELMLQKRFPFPLMGMVHIRNSITQHRAIRIHETMDIHCSFSDIRKTDKGFETDITTVVYASGSVVWESVTTNLVRRKTDIPAPEKSSEPPVLPEYPYREFWSLASDLGRRYAAVSGDSNPIHLFSLSAKLFGFKGHIAHGMWTKARTAAALCNKLDTDAINLAVEFKLPVFLPASVQLNYDITDNGIGFDVRDKDGVKPHVKGSISRL